MRKDDYMTNYESPSIKFETLTLFEKIADDCWASKTITFDSPYDSVGPIYKYDLGSGCGNKSDDKSETQLDTVSLWLQNILKDKYTEWLINNTNSSSNLANTRANGFILTKS